MKYTDKTNAILGHAEKALRALITEATAEGDYDSVARLAAIARALDTLKGGENTVSALATEPVDIATNPSTSKPGQPHRRNYPKFFKADDFLVKVAWSKRRRAEYEHRAPLDALMALVSMLEKRARHTTRFSVDNILPLLDSKNNEVPGYQMYVGLAWLAATHAVERQGRGGYRIVARRPIREHVEEHWASTPSR